MCMTRMTTFDRGRDGHGHAAAGVPGHPRPGHRRVVQLRRRPARSRRSRRRPDLAPGEYRMQQVDVERSQEFRKCIECFLCQNTCHVVRDHEENKQAFAGPRFLIRLAELDMHPLDTARPQATGAGGARPRLLQHHQVLHRGLPRAHQDHRQRDHPDEGARGRPQVRPAGLARRSRHDRVDRTPTPAGLTRTGLAASSSAPSLQVAPDAARRVLVTSVRTGRVASG